MKGNDSSLSDAIRACLISPNECDRNLEAANVVDAIAAAGRDIRYGLEKLADAIRDGRSRPEGPTA